MNAITATVLASTTYPYNQPKIGGFEATTTALPDGTYQHTWHFGDQGDTETYSTEAEAMSRHTDTIDTYLDDLHSVWAEAQRSNDPDMQAIAAACLDEVAEFDCTDVLRSRFCR